ncbi:MAG: 4-(cytidine 5'-diphospho)-2-C-methyl-D-erythritol kinase [Desulfamplus sp.]|nr:4-(cytidine 5'-diphospho)-2-C-methyl-D-erythritol kinase [Desulfamplus sp.]
MTHNNRFVIQSPAKINLFLYVTGRRNDGYHDLFTLMACVSLYDEIDMIFRQPETVVTSDHSGLPDGEANIAFKAVTIFNKMLFSKKKMCSLASPIKGMIDGDMIDRAGCVSEDQSVSFNSVDSGLIRHPPAGHAFNSVQSTSKIQCCSRSIKEEPCLRGVRIHIKKKIPVGAGLGGGSSNAACVLKTMNRFYGCPFSVSELMEMGLNLGADVPFFILGGAAIAEGVGEKLTPIPVLESYHILLFYPGIEASTANVYKNLDLGLTKSVKSNNKCLLKTSEINQGFVGIKGLMHNDLELSASTLYPEIGLFREELVDFLEGKVVMTGSGSTFFSLFSDYEKAKCCFNELSTKWGHGRRQIFLTSFVNADYLS